MMGILSPYDTIFKKLENLIPDLRTLKPGDARTSSSRGFMDLHLDVLTKDEELMRISLHHSYKQNGDMIPDPDMEIRVFLNDKWPMAEALTYQDALVYNEVYPDPEHVRPKLKKSLNSFLLQWLTNIKNQGHSLAPPGAN